MSHDVYSDIVTEEASHDANSDIVMEEAFHMTFIVIL